MRSRFLRIENIKKNLLEIKSRDNRNISTVPAFLISFSENWKG